MNKLSPALEEYLEAIYKLQSESGVARTTKLARELKVALGSVTNTVEKLERLGLVTHEPYRGVKLTESGLKLALSVVRRHRLSERLLTDILRMRWEDVHESACVMEHGLPDKVTSSLEKILKLPKTCPHGNPIPTKDGELIEDKALKPLIEAALGEAFVIIKITEEEPGLLRYLKKRKIIPGALVRIEEFSSANGSVALKIDGNLHRVNQRAASKIWVKKL